MLKLNKNKKDLTINLKEITYNKFNTKKTKMIKDILKARRTNEIKQAIKFILCVALFFFILIAGILIPKDRTNASEGQNTILKDLSLNDCRITQDQDEHIKKNSGSMFAYDIACIRGQSFNVYTPNNRNIYLLEKIGYDDKLGNFIVLKHGDLRFVYGHTTTKLREGVGLEAGEFIGKTDISGISENYHLHIELWAYKSNIKFNYLKTKIPTFNDKSFKLRMQRNIVSASEINGEITKFLCQTGMEGLSLVAYPDGGDRYSIGCGTYSYKGEVISKQEAENRSRFKIQAIRQKYNLDYHKLDVQKAVVSFVYNIGSLTKEQKRLLDNCFYTALGNDFKLYNGIYIINEDGEEEKVILKGLVKRRAKEYNLLTND